MADESAINRMMLVFSSMIDQSSFTKTKMQVEQQTNEILTSTKKIYSVDPQGQRSLQSTVENFKVLNENVRKGRGYFEEMGNAMKRALIVAPVWMAVRLAIQSVTGVISEQLKFLSDMEMAMARIKVVGKGTAEEYDNLKVSLLALSVAYGVSASSALEAAKIFAQQGRTVAETFKLTRIAMLSSVVLGEPIKESVNNITAAIEGFNIPLENSISIVDKWINVEKQFAVTSQDLADATKTAGSTANQLGVTIDSFLGDVTAIVEVTRKSGSQAANALQFIYARVFTSGKKALESIAKVPLYLDAQGKATTAITGNYRGLTDILGELANKWDNLSIAEKRQLAEGLASKRQLTSFMALMQNYNTSLDARIASLASAGAAETAFGILQDTVKIKIERLNASWNALTLAVADTGIWKSSLDGITKVIEAITILTNRSQAIAIIGAKSKDTSLGKLETAKSQIKNLEELMDLRNNYLNRPPAEKNTEQLEKINNAIDLITKKSRINIDIKDKNVKEKLEKLTKELEKREIFVNINTDYQVKIEQMKLAIQNLNNDIIKSQLFAPKGTLVGGEFFKAKEVEMADKLRKMEKELLETQKQKNIDIKTQIGLLESKDNFTKDSKKWEEEASASLTDAELERLSNETKLNDAKASGVLTAQQLLNLEIELTNQSLSQYDAHAKNLKVAELEAQRSSAILADLEKRVSMQSELLRFAGVNESAVLAQEMGIKAMMLGENYINNSMSDRLKLAQSITKEMEEQNKKSSYLVELFKIAKKYGMETAKEVSGYLAGTTKFEDLSKKGQGVVKKVEPKLFEEEKALKFFKEEDKGFKFPEQLTKERETRRNIEILNKIDIQPININVDIDSQRILEQITEAFITELEKKESDFAKAINKKIENF